MEGRILKNKYKIEKEIGRGGMAIVYLAEDTMLKRKVAIKMLHPHMTQKEHIIRFEREALVLATLSHPNIVNIYEFFEEEGNYFIVYEYVKGETLGNFLEKNKIKFPVIGLMIAHEVIEAIEYVHNNGVIHRDIKPDNIMISVNGNVKVMDFGIAKVINNTTVTDAGALLGSPAYMSPEQVVGGEITYKSDIFSLGVLTYKLITGVSPFASNSTAATLKNILNTNYNKLTHPLADKGMERIIESALNKEPSKRIENLSLLKEMIKQKIKDEGLTPPYTEELKFFFKSPEKYQNELKNRLLKHYKKFSYELYKQHNILKSLNYCGKALELSPNDPDLKILSNKLKIFNNSRRLRIITSFLITLSLILIVFLNTFSLNTEKNNYKYKLTLTDKMFLALRTDQNYLKNLVYYTDNYFKQIINLNKKISPEFVKFREEESKTAPKNKIQKSLTTKRKNQNPYKKHIKTIKKTYKISKTNIPKEKNKSKNTTSPEETKKQTNKNSIPENHLEKTVNTEKEKKFGKLIFCFRPYAKVKIDNKRYKTACISSPVKLEYGKHKIVASYPYANDYVREITINSENTKEIRYSFNKLSKVYLNLKSLAPITLSLKDEYGKYVTVKTFNNKNLLFKNRNLKSVKVFFVKPGKYYLDISNGDINYKNLLLKIMQYKKYTVNMDLENDNNIKIQ